MIPPSFVQDLLTRTDIVEVVGRYVELKRAGINQKGLCPFHGEKTPSFIVSPSRQTYHCFGCGAHGNAVGFLMEHAGLSFPDAVRELAGRLGLAIPEDDASPQERSRAAEQRERRATLGEVLARAADHYRRALKANPRAVDYLKGRGLTGEIAARFGLGYAPEGWRSLASAFPRYDDPLLEEAGLVIVRDDGDAGTGETAAAERQRYDRFRDRIMFPIRSVQGDVIGFGGRVIGAGEPKYLNSPETPVFSKGRELYGLYEARQALRQRGYVLVVEGYMDVVALAQSGFANAVATLGTACTAEHVHKLFRFTESVVFSFDGDEAGRRAAARALEASLPHATDTRSVRFLFLPPEHDPDSFVRAEGSEAFDAMVAAAVPLSRQLVQVAGAGCDLATAEGRARLLAQARPLVAQLPEGVLRGQIVDALAEAGRVDAATLRAHWLGTKPPRRDPGRETAGPGWSASHRAPLRRPIAAVPGRLDRTVLLLVHRSDLWETLTHETHDLLTEQPAPYGEFFAWLDRLVHEHGSVASATVLEQLRTEAEPLRALADRLRAREDVSVGEEAPSDLQRLLDGLRLEAVNSELTLLFETEGLSEIALRRAAELQALQRELKARTGPAAPAL